VAVDFETVSPGSDVLFTSKIDSSPWTGSLEASDSAPWSQLAGEPAAARLKPPTSLVPLSQSTGPACGQERPASTLGPTTLPKKVESLGHLMTPGAFDAAVQGVATDQHRRSSLRDHKRVSKISEPWGAANEEGPPAVCDYSTELRETSRPCGTRCSAASAAAPARNCHEESRPVVARELARVLTRSCYTCVAVGRLRFVPQQESRAIAKIILPSVYRSALLFLGAPQPEPEPLSQVRATFPILSTGLRSRFSGDGSSRGGTSPGVTTPSGGRRKGNVTFLLEEPQNEKAIPPCELEDNIKASQSQFLGKRRATGAVNQLALKQAMLNGSGPLHFHPERDAREAEDNKRDLTKTVLRLCYEIAAGKEAAKKLSMLYRSAE